MITMFFLLPAQVFRRLCSRIGLAVVAAALLLANQSACAQNWPVIILPKDVQAFDIGQQVAVNGMPMRAQGFVSSAKPAQLVEQFRQSLGKPLVENTIGSKLILGRAQGEHYLTVQIEPAGMGSRGVVAVTHLKAAYDAQADNQASAERLLSRLPSGSRLLSQMASQDGGKLSRHLIIINSHSEALNRDRLKSLMAEDGFVFEREGTADNQAAAKLPEGLAKSKTLFFKAAGKEAMATIHRDSEGRTAIVVNTITLMERFK